MDDTPIDPQEPGPGPGAPADPELSAGTTVGDYDVVRRVGAGSFGTVYEGRHPLIGKRVAIKVLARKYAVEASTVDRFIREARIVNEIHHRNIVDIFAFDELPDGRPYFVMEYLDGPTLEQYLKEKGKVPLSEALPLLRQIASALDAAHRLEVAHRDVKPANIMLPMEEGRPAAKLIDFGIAKLSAEQVQPVQATQNGTIMGTPRYMSPEQWRSRNVDFRTDVYSFGLIVYEMLTGQPVFSAEENADLMMQQTHQAPPRASHTNPELPPAIDGPILAALEKDPARRPEQLVPLVDELECVLGAPSRGESWTRRLMLAGGLGAVALAVILEVRLWAPTEATSHVQPPTHDAVVAQAPLPPEPALIDTPAHPPKVRIVLTGKPTGARVFGPDGALLGKLPATIELPWSDKSVHLRVGTRGVDLTPATDLQVVVPPPAARVPRVHRPRDPNEPDIPHW